MFIKLQAMNPYKGNELKSTRERLDRQEKRDNQIAFYEQQKENLKGMRAETLEEISRKLNLLHGYDDQIALAKKEYNNSQMMHVMDEAVERGEKIAEEAEKYAPKTPEERKEEMIEEATGVEKNEGMLSEIMDEMTDAAEETNLDEGAQETNHVNVVADGITPETGVVESVGTNVDVKT